MIIFQLAVYSCISVTSSFNGDFSKTCNWAAKEMYVEASRCNKDGMSLLGDTIHEFSVIIGATPRKIESYSCNPVTVIE